MSFKFHRECIDCWLLHRKNTCPIDEYVIYNPLTWKDTPAKQENFPAGSHTSVKKLVKQGKPEMCVSGSQIYLKQGSSAYTSGCSESSFKKLSNNSVPETQKDLRSFSDLHLGNSDPYSSRTLCNFSRRSKDISLSSRKAAFSVKSSTIRKADIHNAFRSPHLTDCSKTRKVFPIRKDDCDNSTNEKYPRELNLKINLCATSHSSKKGSKDMGNTSHQHRLLTKRLPKDNHLNFKQTKTDLLLEGIPLHASSRFPCFK